MCSNPLGGLETDGALLFGLCLILMKLLIHPKKGLFYYLIMLYATNIWQEFIKVLHTFLRNMEVTYSFHITKTHKKKKKKKKTHV